MRLIQRIGTCRKKVMGLLRLMGNKADVVKGLAKRCEHAIHAMYDVSYVDQVTSSGWLRQSRTS